MQPDKSQLFESLKAYLNNTKRLQPVIGLDSIIECVTAGTPNREPLYLCSVCVCRCGKADIRNHIFGSQHRFNYIKAWHPQLVHTWQDDSDLSEKAWPLMELAKTVEKKEGTGEAKLIEVEAAAYQMMATLGESDAVTLINFLRKDPAETLSSSVTTSLHHPVESQRIILQNQQRHSQESLKDDMITFKFDNHQTSHEIPEVTESSTSSLGDDTGGPPLIGLFHVVEYRSENGCSRCFLCHCCRIRSNNEDIIDHLTSSPHLLNTVMETHPELLEEVTADMKDSCEFLQSLAKKLQQQEGRGDLKVITVPESVCRQLAAKSYHWCVKILHTKWMHANFQEKKVTLKAPTATDTAVRGMHEKNTAKRTCKPKTRAKSNKSKKAVSSADTVFTVSLPLSEGALLLEKRTSFSMDSPCLSPESPSSGPEVSHSSEYQILDCDLDSDTGSFTGNYDDHTSPETSHYQDDRHGNDTDADVLIPKKNLEITFFKDASDCSREDLYYNQYEHENYEERGYNKQQSSHETSSEQWQNKNDMELLPAASHAQDWAASYSQEEHGECMWYGSSSWNRTEAQVGTPGVETHATMSFDASRHYDQNPYSAGHFTSFPMGGAWDFYNPAPYLYSGTNTQNHAVRNDVAHYGLVLSEPGVQLLHTEPRMQSHQGFAVDQVQTAPQSH